MKLNLLPQTEKKSRRGKTAVLVGVMIVLAALGGAAALTFIPLTQLRTAKEGISDLETRVARADAVAKSADVVIAEAADVIRNASLAQAMIDHNDAYPKLYDDIKRYIPPYYRIQSMTATPLGENQSQLTLVGTLSGYQHYADLMLALMRFPDATAIARQGYNLDDPVVPPLTVQDQVGKMRKQGEAPVPDDGLERLAYFQAKAAAEPQGYLGQGGYGDGTTEVRGPLPNASVVTITMTVSRDLRVPLAAETLRAAGGAAAGGAATFGGPGAPGVPAGAMGPSGPPGVPSAGRGAGAD